VIPPNDPFPTGRFVSGKMVQAVLESCNVHQNPQLLEMIKTRFGFDLDFVPTNFPYDKYMQINEFVARELYPQQDLQTALEKIGYDSVHYYFRHPTGQILKTMAGVLGVQRGAKIFVQNMKHRLPWGIHELEEVQPKYVRYRVRLVPGTGAMIRGTMRASVEVTGGKIKSLKTTLLDFEDMIHELEVY
jgi:uncharacterized protein (TIGR02265 family)